MKGVLIRIKDGHQMDGQGEKLGTAHDGSNHTFWRSAGHQEVPVDLAIKLERERPQRFEMVDRIYAAELLGEAPPPEATPAPVAPVSPGVHDPGDMTVAKLNDMTKDEINDWCAKRDYDANPGRQNKTPMIKSLLIQIEKRHGIKLP
ncbi:MAG: hypothetical protein GY861_17555 [bacterium]|nr:hypothetical protein [bacterium]